MSYITNFNPSVASDIKNLQYFNKSKSKNKLISKNFFLFLLLLKYCNNNNKKYFINNSLFIKPFFKKLYVILRAPYRHKLSRHQIIINRYYVVYSMFFYTDDINIKSNEDIIYILNKFKKFYVWFESNIVYQHQVKVFFDFNFVDNFLYERYL
jgi:hypothetical protein